MYLMIEAWTPRPAWLALTPDERTAYVGGVGEGVAAFAAFAVWECGSREGCDALRAAIAQAGWYEYFGQVDFGGEAGPPESVLGHHIALQGDPA